MKPSALLQTLLQHYRKHTLWYVLGAALGVLILLSACNPAAYAWMPKCPFKMLTGLDCPGCGFQRATHALLHGQVREAIGYNLFLVYSVPYLLCVAAVGFLPSEQARRQGIRIFHGRTAVCLYLTLYVLWGVVRNILHL